MNIKIKLALIWVISLTTCFTFLQAADTTALSLKSAEQTLRDRDDDFDDCDDCDDCETRLRISNLCAKRIRAIKARFKELCAEHIKTDFVCTDSLTVNYSLNVNDMCIRAVSTADLCVSGTARITETCSNYSAFAQYSANTTYTLGDLLNFDQIVDNPAGSLTTGPTSYIVPASGYYVFGLAIHQLSLNPTIGAILGTPVAQITILVNGVTRRTGYFPYLTFNNAQDSVFSTVFFLAAGDVITASYNILALNQTSGLLPVDGSIVIAGGTGTSNIVVHYLSSTCTAGQCSPCTPNTGSAGLPCDNQCVKPCNRN